MGIERHANKEGAPATRLVYHLIVMRELRMRKSEGGVVLEPLEVSVMFNAAQQVAACRSSTERGANVGRQAQVGT